jgi:tetratricopeptide (TPR) repeat protein
VSEPAAITEPRFSGLGSYRRPISTRSPAAQAYFDQGLLLLYAFNHDEAIRSFQQAARLDPDAAMAWWGIAIANGPHINNPVVPPEREKAAWQALHEARGRIKDSSPVEVALIEAAVSRYADPQPEDRSPLDQAFAKAMRTVWERYPQDADVGALYAEAMMDLRPWDLWQDDGTPQPGTEEIIATLERVMAFRPDHPLALHLYIHAVEASPQPERADSAADRLRDLTPGLGHLTHMPSHIDVRRGRWQEAIVANTKAIRADDAYRSQVPRQGFYGLYLAHNRHMLAFGAMMNGQSALAIRAMDEILSTMPAEWAKELSMIADGYHAMPFEVRMRFGKWEEILAAPDLPEYFPLARALRLCARGVAYAALGNTREARAEQADFKKAKSQIPGNAFFGNNKAADLVVVAEHLLEGEIAYREGKEKAALAALRTAVEHEDRLRYDEPPDWIQPVRHALGAALLKSRRFSEAEEVFREDLRRLPNNGWGLYGLARSLERQGKAQEAALIDARFREVWAGADIEISSPCFCQPQL